MAGVNERNQPAATQLNEFMPGANKLRVGNYLGLAMKAGRVAAGDMAASKALLSGQTQLLVIAQDTASATAAELIALAAQRNLPLLWWPDKAALGLLVGKSPRGALALLDEGFSAAILKLCMAKNSDDNHDEKSK